VGVHLTEIGYHGDAHLVQRWVFVSVETGRRSAGGTAAGGLADASPRRPPPVPSSLDSTGTISTIANPGAWCRDPHGYVEVGCRHGSGMWVPLRCRHCPGCQARHRKLAQMRIERGLKALGGPVAMLTLTSLPGATVGEFMRAWNGYRTYLRRLMPDLQYAAVKERGARSGMLHLHVLLSGWRYVPQAELSREWGRRSGAPVVWVNSRRAELVAVLAEYLSKYVSKALGHGDVRKAVSYSAGFPRLPSLEKAWRVTGAKTERGLPAVTYTHSLGTGCLVTRDRGCVCLEGARSVGLDGHLFLQRIQDRGPPR